MVNAVVVSPRWAVRVHTQRRLFPGHLHPRDLHKGLLGLPRLLVGVEFVVDVHDHFLARSVLLFVVSVLVEVGFVWSY